MNTSKDHRPGASPPPAPRRGDGGRQGRPAFPSSESERPIKTCLECGNSFSPLRSRQVWCSKSCAAKGRFRPKRPDEWTDAELSTLRDLYGRAPTLEVATACGRTVSAVHVKAGALGLRCSYRFWSERQDEELRELYRSVPTAEVARRLGRSVPATQQRARILGLAHPEFCPSPAQEERIRLMVAAGATDREMALAFGVRRAAIARTRARLRLSAGRATPEGRRKAGSRTRSRDNSSFRAAGSAAVRRATAAFAERSGWPPDLRPRQVQILNLLAAAGLPLAMRAVGAALGFPCRARGRLDASARHLFYDLRNRGLLVDFPNGRVKDGGGAGQQLSVWTLGPLALSILEERAACEAKNAD